MQPRERGEVAVDRCADYESVAYPMGTAADLEQTAALARELGVRIATRQVDVRERGELAEALRSGLAELGSGLHIVVANAGIAAMQPVDHPSAWDDVMGVNVTGVFHTVEAARPILIEQGLGGAIVLTGSTAGLTNGYGDSAAALAYSAAKHGVVGLMRVYARNLGRFSIRVNAVHPSAVDTAMARAPELRDYLTSVREHVPGSSHALPVDILEPADVSAAVAFLVSDEARHITGVNLPVDAGYSD